VSAAPQAAEMPKQMQMPRVHFLKKGPKKQRSINCQSFRILPDLCEPRERHVFANETT
jgi:hypothetical protein